MSINPAEVKTKASGSLSNAEISHDEGGPVWENVAEAMRATETPVRVAGAGGGVRLDNRPWPPPAEDPWERWRAIAAEALGYQKPEPMVREGRMMYASPLIDNLNMVFGQFAESRIKKLEEDLATVRYDNLENATEAAVLRAEHVMLLDDIGRYKQANRYLQDCVDNLPNMESVKEMLAAKDARIAELDTRLAGMADADAGKPPAAPATGKVRQPDGRETSVPTGHNPFNVPPSDPRRIGG